MMGIDPRRSAEGHNASRLAMSWKDRQRKRVPAVDLDDNPFCVERRINEERHMMQINRNPSLVHLTSADVPRTASFAVDAEKPFRDFARKKRSLLAWSLRAATHSGTSALGKANRNPRTGGQTSGTLPSESERSSTDEFFNQERVSSGHGCTAARGDVDIDTLPNLEPYRREVVAQQPITFGHRPSSASRMFNPSTMATSCGVSSGFDLDGGVTGDEEGGAISSRRNVSRARKQSSLKRRRGRDGKTHTTTGLSPPMLKALLRGDADLRPPMETSSLRGDLRQEGVEELIDASNPSRDLVANSKRLVPGGQDNLSDRSVNSEPRDECMWRSLNRASERAGTDLQTTWLSDRLTSTSQEGLEQPRVGLRDSVESRELQRIFSHQKPPWDGTPAPLPAPREVRRAISSLLMPDPDERLRDKLIKFRKAAAGIPVTASSTKDEREGERSPWNPTPFGRWEPCPRTPRAVIAQDEIRRLKDARCERDSIMAERVRKAELRVFYKKITPSEELYRRTLKKAQGKFQRQAALVA